MRQSIRRYMPSRRERLTLWGLLGLLFILLSSMVLWSTALYRQQLTDEAYRDASRQLSFKANELRLGVERRVLLTESLVAFVETELRYNGYVDYGRFNQFSSHFVPALPDVKNLSLYPSGVAWYVYPQKGNELLLGVNLFQDTRPAIRENAERARGLRTVTLVGPLELIQGGSGLVTRQSVYHDDQFWGFASVVLDMKDLLGGISDDFQHEQFDIALRVNGNVLLGESALFGGSRLRELVDVPDGTWELAGQLKEEALRQIETKLWLARFGSAAVMMLVLYLLYVQLTGRYKLEAKVDERTRELQEANEEIEASNEELIAIEEELREQNRMLASKERELHFLAYRDPLTGLFNRSCFNLHLEQTIARAGEQPGKGVALLYLDLDQFKLVNDTFGHQLGDHLLREASLRLTDRQERGLERMPGDGPACFRLGGDEFTVVLPGVSGMREAEVLADAIIGRFRMPFQLRGAEYFLTTSIGIALYPDHGADAEELTKHADLAMYRAKEEGKNHYKWFDGTEEAGAAELMELRNGLRRALERGEFELHYQPQIEAASGRLTGLEALLRWNHPRFGQVSPQKFIPLAEETGLIVEIGAWALREACAQNKAWQDAGAAGLRIAVNLSARQFAAPDLVGTVRRVLEDTGLDPSCLELEITENMAMRNENLATLEQLRDMGILLSIDDFGTQHSSLSYLKRLPVGRIKIDRSFVSGIGVDERDEAIIHAMLLIARRLKLSVVAEGVESDLQLSYLLEHDCDEIQGYLFFRPQSAEQTGEVLRRIRHRPSAPRKTGSERA
ncbi:EAL domain-containing protein [Paenibacillus albicereus]|uniref:EAL domain-containing protein n=1 Tax=Paenibacillus albicereus TaxID=2726185 RepID=A0A6H2H0Z2_9BACL|nr:EAL domain-containing protein [Paenibacillus albicereus]QJC53315.1 EAL domain-containing protein [Paenibacillus albicereus]